MPLDKRNRFLLQTQENGRQHIYIWSQVLATKPDMKPISYENAVKMQKKIADDGEAARYKTLNYVPEIIQDNEVIEHVAAIDEDTMKAEEVMKLARTNEDILASEIKKVQGFTSKDDLEEFFLLKYRIELLQENDLEAMKKEAGQVLLGLSNTNKLYEVK